MTSENMGKNYKLNAFLQYLDNKIDPSEQSLPNKYNKKNYKT